MDETPSQKQRQACQRLIALSERVAAEHDAIRQAHPGQHCINLRYEDELGIDYGHEFWVDSLDDVKLWCEAALNEHGKPDFRWQVTIRGESVYDRIGEQPILTSLWGV